jgi:hypothetical protein
MVHAATGSFVASMEGEHAAYLPVYWGCLAYTPDDQPLGALTKAVLELQP